MLSSSGLEPSAHDDSSKISQHFANSNMANVDDILNEKLEKAYHKETSEVVIHDFAKIASEHSPIDLAYAAFRLPPSIRPLLYENLQDLDAKSDFMVNTDPSTRIAVFRHISDLETKKLIEHMAPDDAVFILEDVSERRFRKILDLLDIHKVVKIRELQKHPRNTAGRLMTNEFFSFTMEISLGEAAAHIRDNPGIDLTRRIFILNQAGELQGYVPARNLIVNSSNVLLRQVMQPISHKVSVDTSREEVIDIVERYKISALPVVDAYSQLVGVITYETVLEAMEDIADELMARMSGTIERIREVEPLYKRFLSRAPWLIFTLIAGLINVSVISTFQTYEGVLLPFALFFIPLITGLSGNIGIQCSTILVRNMAMGVMSSASKKEAAKKELLIGLTTGLVFGIICGLCIYVFDIGNLSLWGISPFAIGLIVSSGLFGACLSASFLGVFSPLFFSRIGVDPAVASGPIVAACNDFLSMSIYFLITIGLGALLF